MESQFIGSGTVRKPLAPIHHWVFLGWVLVSSPSLCLCVHIGVCVETRGRLGVLFMCHPLVFVRVSLTGLDPTYQARLAEQREPGNSLSPLARCWKANTCYHT